MSEDDITLDFDSVLPPLIPSGGYTVSFIRAEKKWLWGKRLKIFLHFEIVHPTEYAGLRLYMAANVPPKNQWTIGCKYYRTWAMASGHRPRRRDRLSTQVFRDKYFIARIKTVDTTANGTARAEAAQYSIIDELLEIAAGRL
ncbi:MAG: hypothetical protein H8K03_12150 [Nitrospira sp.]